MARWITIEKSGNAVRFEDGTPFTVGQRVSMGLGSIELRDTKKAGLHVVRLSSNGHFSYSFKLKRDGQYRLGPNRGHRVVTAAEETDPIKRVLREMDIPVSKLCRMEAGSALPISTYDCDIRRAYPSGTTTNWYLTDGKQTTEVTSSKDMTGVNQFCGPEVSEVGAITGATYAIETVRRVHMNSCIGRYIGTVAVWPGCDPKNFADVLAPLVYGEFADAEFPEALKDFETAQRWVAERFEIATHPTRGELLTVDGRDYQWATGPYTPYVIERLVQAHGIRLLQPYFGEEQRAFQGALLNGGLAAEYVLTHYRVVAVQCGEERHLKFALLTSSDKLGDINSVYLGGQEEVPLKTLLEKHNTLKDLLFVQATERMELVPTHTRISSYKLKDGVWEAETYNDQRGWHKFPLFVERDALLVRLGENEFTGALVCLSCDTRRQGMSQRGGGGFHAVHQDGAQAYYHAYEALLPIRIGETKNFVFRISHEWSSPCCDASIWGVTVTRTEQGVQFRPYDNGQLYVCAGYWGGEVSRQPLTK